MRPPPNPAIDPALIQRCKEGCRSSMEALYRTCLPVLWPVAWRYARDEADARDIFNTAMLKVFRALPQFEDDNLLGWMRTIVIHTGIDAIRSRNRQGFSEEITPAMAEAVPEPSVDGQLAQEDIMRAVHTLPEPLRTVLLLFAVEGFSHAEIAERMGITVANSRWRLNQARQQMKTLLSKLAIAL
jgi:RNA polymerase sigma factor (sigma-70 family)